MKIYLDFDGTCVEHEFPKIGRCNFGCVEVIKKLQDAGHEVILNTYRAECPGDSLADALEWINELSWMLIKDRSLRGEIELTPITHTPKKINAVPWNLEMAKLSDEIYIDDYATGIPLKPCVMITGNMVDWDEVEKQLIEYKIIS